MPLIDATISLFFPDLDHTHDDYATDCQEIINACRLLYSDIDTLRWREEMTMSRQGQYDEFDFYRWVRRD